jgi:hypothetical protein
VDAFGLLDRVNGDDIGMVESRNGLSFALESVTTFLRGHLRREDLEGYVPMELGVLGDIDLPHAASSELLEYLVMGQGLANHDSLPSMA